MNKWIKSIIDKPKKLIIISYTRTIKKYYIITVYLLIFFFIYRVFVVGYKFYLVDLKSREFISMLKAIAQREHIWKKQKGHYTPFFTDLTSMGNLLYSTEEKNIKIFVFYKNKKESFMIEYCNTANCWIVDSNNKVYIQSDRGTDINKNN